jgi:mono/diheme cytochrome c family protein
MKTSTPSFLATVGLALLLLHEGPISAQPKVPQPEVQPQAEKYLINSLDGQSLYITYCATCHGSDGKGSGPTATALKTPPADLTQIAVRNSGVFSPRKVERAISGELETLAHGTREMPLWGPIFSQIAWDQDLGRLRVANLVKYLESIQKAPAYGGDAKR